MNFRVEKLNPFGVLIEAKENMNLGEISIEELQHFFKKHQLVLIRGFNKFRSSQNFSDYCSQWGEVAVWPFGKVLELREHEDPKDHIFDHSYVPLHWDGMYRLQVPEYQIFQCESISSEKNGGRTIFVNTRLALRNSSKKYKELWSKVTGIYEREMEFYKSKSISPIITKHPFKGYSVIRYNQPHSKDKGHLINPVNMDFEGIPKGQQDDFYQSLEETLHDQKNMYTHSWKEGDILIADNFTLLHGREEFKSNTIRHIRRVQVLSSPPFDNPAIKAYM